MHLTSKAGSIRYSGKTVPEESGAWGWLLPVGGAPRKETPAAHGTVVEISPACLRLQTPSDALRGFAAVGAYALGVWMAFGAVFFMVKFDASTRGYDSVDFILVSALSIVLALVGLISGSKLTFSKVFDSVIFSRRLRRIYHWEKGVEIGRLRSRDPVCAQAEDDDHDRVQCPLSVAGGGVPARNAAREYRGVAHGSVRAAAVGRPALGVHPMLYGRGSRDAAASRAVAGSSGQRLCLDGP